MDFRASARDPKEPRERAISAEPSTTRPNPFDDDNGITSRKRRRTSHSGSPARSIDILRDASSSIGPIFASSPAMAANGEPALPSTPEDQGEEYEPPVAPASSSKVTINLRNAASAGSAAGSQTTPTTPTPGVDKMPMVAESPILGPDSVASDDVVEVLMTPAPPISERRSTTPGSASATSTGSVQSSSSQMEAIDDGECDQDDDSRAADVLELSSLMEPCAEMPFFDPEAETPDDCVIKIANYIQCAQHVAASIYQDIRVWLEKCATYFSTAGLSIAAASYSRNCGVWKRLPDIVLNICNRRPYLQRTNGVRPNEIATLLYAFVDISFLLARFDLQFMSHAMRDLENTLEADIAPRSTEYLATLVDIAQGRVPTKDFDEDTDAATERIRKAVMDYAVAKKSMGAMEPLSRMIGLQASLVTRFPILIESLGATLQFAVVIAKAVGSDQGQTSHAMDMFMAVSDKFPALLDKLAAHKNSDCVMSIIRALCDIYRVALYGRHAAEAAERVDKYQVVDSRPAPDAVLFAWRFDVLSRVIQSSHMQLRVQAVTSLCEDLVRAWKTSQEWPHDRTVQTTLGFYIDHVAKSALIQYILGPTCRPEIVVEAGNIVGLLAVSKSYKRAHFDMFWQTMTTSQDPRVRQSLVRMMSPIMPLFDEQMAAYMCEKLFSLDVAAFGQSVRGLCELVFKHQSGPQLELPCCLCLRLLRESVCFSARSQVAHQEVADWAADQLRGLIQRWSDPAGRHTLALRCIQDIAAKSPTTLGSLTFLSTTGLRNQLLTELNLLADEHDLARLLIEELEHAILAGQQAGYPAVLSHTSCSPRRNLIELVILHRPETLSGALGRRLWDVLVGSDASCPEDRDAGWQIVNTAADDGRLEFDGDKRHSNPYISTCLADYIRTLPSSCFCNGALGFLRRAVVARVGESGSVRLDDNGDEADLAATDIAQLWRMILLADSEQLANEGIEILARNVYLDNKLSIRHAHQRVREVHLSVARRCLGQLKDASQQLKLLRDDGTARGGDDESLSASTNKERVCQQERVFSRSLNLLSYFERMHQSRPHFSSQDLGSYRSLSLAVSSQGEPADLRYQAFDGLSRTEILPLDIGKQNTGAALLALLHATTGFDNYRVFWRGSPIEPNERSICQSLEELSIHDGVLLVKNEALATPIPENTKPGASPLQIEILAHFGDFWDYLDLDDDLAHQVYIFLTHLPADSSITELFGRDRMAPGDVFPTGKVYKCLYVTHALKEHLHSLVRRIALDAAAGHGFDNRLHPVLVRALWLVAVAISDVEVVDHGDANRRQLLAHGLIDALLSIATELRERGTPLDVGDSGHVDLDRLVAMATIHHPVGDVTSMEVSLKAFAAMLDLCLVDADFWRRFQSCKDIPAVLFRLIVAEPADNLRITVIESLRVRVQGDLGAGQVSNGTTDRPDDEAAAVATRIGLASFVYHALVPAIRDAADVRHQSRQLFDCMQMLLNILAPETAFAPSLARLATVCAALLLQYPTTEELGRPQHRDDFVAGIVRLLHYVMPFDQSGSIYDALPRNLALGLMKGHLFPTRRLSNGDGVPRSVVTAETRATLYTIVTDILRHDGGQREDAVRLVGDLVPYRSALASEDGSGYDYDLSSCSYERYKNIRSPCGYVGLRNLANTCYFNSLLSQLFMNTEFRRFMLSTAASGSPASSLILDTQILFANMQESHTRFIDTWCLVRSIKTYDDTAIDINNQMDVDEFYNLLFDRWEAHMAGPDERKALRSFYGGLLVQQVKSKECAHVSTRTESFQAIQCDIKNKSTLQESLQAYVGGETMAGENKYKCSTCNHEVVAVKRACLEEIPDNLIFHLKRFEFNLRTMQRAKINDYFSFPTSIDMRPYTREYLESVDDGNQDEGEDAGGGANGAANGKPDGAANATTNGTNKGATTINGTSGEPDMFELVGILVHAGTAESGHYYSFVRERPSSRPEGATQWIQFNDETVTRWDSNAMENCTFGGSESGAGRHGIEDSMYHEKQHSAYMLFYERASTLARRQTRAVASHVRMPLQVPVPFSIVEPIRQQNTMLLRQYCIFDPTHITFVDDLMVLMWKGGAGRPASLEAEDATMSMVLGHLDQVVARVRDLPSLGRFVTILTTRMRMDPMSALVLVGYFHGNPEVLRYLVQKHPEPRVRESCADLYVQALATIKTHLGAEYVNPRAGDGDGDDSVGNDGMPSGVVMDAVGFLRRLWGNFHANSRAWNTTFGLVLGFARMGDLETMLLLSEDWLFNLMRIIWVHQEEAPINYVRMRINISKPGRSSPDYGTIIMLIRHLMGGLDTSFRARILDSASERAALYHGSAKDETDRCLELPWTVAELNLLHTCAEEDPDGADGADGTSGTDCQWVERLVALTPYDEEVRSAMDWIICRLVTMSPLMDDNIYATLVKKVELGMDGLTDLAPFLRASVAWCLHSRKPDMVSDLLMLPARSDPAPSEARTAIEFYGTILDQSRSLRPRPVVFSLAMRTIPHWVPDMLMGLNGSLRIATESFLDTYLFGFASDAEGETAGDDAMAVSKDQSFTRDGAPPGGDMGEDAMSEVTMREDDSVAGADEAGDAAGGAAGGAADGGVDDAADDEADDEGDDIAHIVAETGRDLAIECLRTLETNYAATNKQATRDMMARIRYVVVKCRGFFDGRWQRDDDADGQDLAKSRDEYDRGFTNILEPLLACSVDETEDDGSVGWDSQSASSDLVCPADELDMQGLGEFDTADTEM